jgi:hypothetical protein
MDEAETDDMKAIHIPKKRKQQIGSDDSKVPKKKR